MHVFRPALLLLSLAATPAAAQDYPPAAPLPPRLDYAPVYEDAPAEVFAGPRLEAYGGWDRVGLRLRETSTSATGSIRTASARGSDDGVLYGGALGWDFAISRSLIVGVQAGIEESSVRECAELFGLDRACLKAGRTVEIGGRIGQALGTHAMVYARAAYVSSRINATYVNFEGILPNASDKADLDGFRLAAGLEAALSPNLYLKGEYRYTDYDNLAVTDPGNDGSSTRTTLGIGRHQVLGGIGLRF